MTKSKSVAKSKQPKLHPPRRRVRDRREKTATRAPLKAVPRPAPPVSAQEAPREAQATEAAPVSEPRLPAPAWTSKRVRLGELAPWNRNPRRINAAQAARLRDSFEHYGQVEVLAIGPELQLYNGHQRLKVLLEQHGPDFEIEVRQSSRALTEKEREKLTIYLHRGAAGDFDLEMLLKDWSIPELDSWGFPDLNVPDDAVAEWQGMPEFDGKPRTHHELIVFFDKPEDLAAFAAMVNQPVTTDTVSIWYPQRVVLDQMDKQWASSANDAGDVPA